MPDFELVVNGTAYGGWKSIAVRKSLDQLAHSFEVDFTERWRPDQEPVPLREGDACEVKIDGELVTAGYIDDFGQRYTWEQHELSVAGRSKTSDLVDCSTPATKSQLRNPTYRDLVKTLLEPFSSGTIQIEVGKGVDLSAKVGRYHQPEPGSSIHEVLEDFARQLGCLLQTTAEGNLLFTRASTDRIATEIRAENILSGSVSGSFRDRFSSYVFVGATDATDDWFGTKAADIKGEVSDPTVPRHRPLVIVPMYHGAKEDLGRRAIWERNTRAGRSEVLRYKVQGWSHGDGLWEPNVIVHVADERLRFEDDMLLTSVDLIYNEDEGTIARLELMGPKAYDVGDPPPERRRKRRR